MKVSVKVVDEGDLQDFELPNDALIGDLKEALATNEGVVDPNKRVRIYFKTTSGHELGTYVQFSLFKITLLLLSLILGVEDDETIADELEKLGESGEFLAKFSDLSTLHGKVKIDVEQSLVGKISILMGATKLFEHFELNHVQNAVPVPNAKVKQLVNGILPFEFCHNKIALVEKENKKDYIAMQYLIENAWNLVVTKCLDQEAENTWELKQKMDGGQLRDLPGTRKVYHDQKAKNPKIIQS